MVTMGQNEQSLSLSLTHTHTHTFKHIKPGVERKGIKMYI